MKRILLIIFPLFSQFILAQETGQGILGEVRDKETQKGLEFVNFIIPGTSHGASSELDGSFKIEGIPDSPDSEAKLCSRAAAGLERLYHPRRLKFPQRRGGKRGSGKWERITWEEALDEIAEKLIHARDKFGA